MAISFTHRIENNTLIVTAQGIDDSLEEVANYGRSVLAVAKETHCSTVLCDERNLVYTLSDVDTYLPKGPPKKQETSGKLPWYAVRSFWKSGNSMKP